MTQEHPITPSEELVRNWLNNMRSDDCIGAYPHDMDLLLATQAARWGADQELDACCEWFLSEGWHPDHPNKLRAARRPKPPSLKEQALEAAQRFYTDGHEGCSDKQIKDDFDSIRRALESLPD